MAKKRTYQQDYCYMSAPESLADEPFYGLELDEEQRRFRDAIWDPNIRFVTVDAVAGSGKTTIAIATACLLYNYHLVDGCIYCRTPSSEGKIGFLPGDQQSKERPYMQPLYNTLIKLGENPFTCISDGSMENSKYQTGYWCPITDVYLLGDDFSKKVIVIDEAQCMKVGQLKTIITRCHDDCKVMVIGSTLQVQGIGEEESGFTHCIQHFEGKPWAAHCTLSKNYRGEMSAWADCM